MISSELKKQFEKIIEINNINWSTIESVCKSDANILRPIKGIGFEEYFKKIVSYYSKDSKIVDGEGDSDIDLFVNGHSLQLKTNDKGSTKKGEYVGVALHKTHGNETRPHNLYSRINPTFDFLVLKNPESGVYIIPHNEIPEHNSWRSYLADPAKIEWQSKWLNRWGLIGLNDFDGINLNVEINYSHSDLPFLSSQTNLEDFEIIQMLIKPEYFRAAVMGLKGNLKEFWFKKKLSELGYEIKDPDESYPKYDCIVMNKSKSIKVQIKGTSKNMCDFNKRKIGVEVMGTHGQFPKRGYNKKMFDYLSIILSEEQINTGCLKSKGLQFVIIPMKDLPLHYRIGNGEMFQNPKWDMEEFSDVIYPNIKFKFTEKNNQILIYPDLESYKKFKGLETIPLDSSFRFSGPYCLNEIPEEFNN